jgi:hypothetical protein
MAKVKVCVSQRTWNSSMVVCHAFLAAGVQRERRPRLHSPLHTRGVTVAVAAGSTELEYFAMPVAGR